MSLLSLTSDLKKVAFIGLAKNTGKTIAMLTLINELFECNKVFGITSIGHDGEKFDQTNNLIGKPRIFLPQDSLVSTTDRLIQESLTPCRIVLQTDYFTPLGRVCIANILQSGEIEVAGPSTASGISQVADQMLDMGAEKVLIDGAINRKAIASPNLSQGVFIATGAVLSRVFNDVLRETKVAILSFQLQKTSRIFVQNIFHPESNFFINSNNRIVAEIEGSLLNNYHRIEPILRKERPIGLVANKSITENFLNFILDLKKRILLANFEIILHDYTKLFLETRDIEFYAKYGLQLSVMNPIRILAITVNPVAPLSHSFNSERLVSDLEMTLKGIQVMDVMSPNYRKC